MLLGFLHPYMILLGLLLVGVGEDPAPRATRMPRAPRAAEAVLSVTTFNVNYARASDAKTVAAIFEAPADLIFLQETNRDWQRQVQPRLATQYPYQSWIEKHRAGGQAVLSRYPISSPQILPSPVGWFPALRVIAKTPLGKIQILSVHLHPQITEGGSWLLGHFVTSAARLAEISRYATSLEPLPTLIVGDFNEGTDGEALRFLQARGFRSALPEFLPAAQTWHFSLGGFELCGQLDHLLYDDGFWPLRAAVARSGNSDHFPVRAEFIRAAAFEKRPPTPQGAALTLRLLR